MMRVMLGCLSARIIGSLGDWIIGNASQEMN